MCVCMYVCVYTPNSLASSNEGWAGSSCRTRILYNRDYELCKSKFTPKLARCFVTLLELELVWLHTLQQWRSCALVACRRLPTKFAVLFGWMKSSFDNDIVIVHDIQGCDALPTFESHYSLAETNSGQLSTLSPHPIHPVVVVSRALMNIIKCYFLGLLTSLLVI